MPDRNHVLMLNIMANVDKVKSVEMLDEIDRAIHIRRLELRRRKARKLARILEVGDVVRLSNNMKPKYLNEVEGPIVKLDTETATIQMPLDGTLRRLSGVRVGVPLSAISKRVSKSTG